MCDFMWYHPLLFTSTMVSEKTSYESGNPNHQSILKKNLGVWSKISDSYDISQVMTAINPSGPSYLSHPSWDERQPGAPWKAHESPLGVELMPRTAGVSTGAPPRRRKQVQQFRVLPRFSAWTCAPYGVKTHWYNFILKPTNRLVWSGFILFISKKHWNWIQETVDVYQQTGNLCDTHGDSNKGI